VSALDDPVRHALYRALVRSPVPLSRDQLVRMLNFPPSTTAFHLERLVREGLLETESRKWGTRTGPGSGRPTKLYKPVFAEGAFSDAPLAGLIRQA
jgi:predicted ArsR family transcriptional regulator